MTQSLLPAVHTEIAADGKRLVVMATGPVVEVAYLARLLDTLTPLFSPTQPTGALYCPLTWPAVVQIAATFREHWAPGPNLLNWIAEQTVARIPDAIGGVYVPEGLTAWPHQLTGAAQIAATGRALIFDEPRCLYGDAEISINRAGKGSPIKLRDLVARFAGEGRRAGAQWRSDIETFVQREVDGVVRLGRLRAAWCSGIRTTFTLTTDSGRSIRASAEHPFMTSNGWARLDALSIGDALHVRGAQSTGRPRLRKPDYVHVAGLPAHPFAHGAGRRTSRYRVAQHRLAAEADRNGLDYAVFVDKIRAGDVGGLEFLNPLIYAVHHRDHDPLNNALHNLEVLTHDEHHRRHADEGKTNSVLFKIVTERVASIERYGDELTYDIQVDDDPHNFLANGFVVHNTGKTITTVLGLAERQRRGLLSGPLLVICPAAVVDPWLEAIEDWAPTWRAVAWTGARRLELLGSADVYVTSYETATRDTPDTHPRRSPLIGLDPAAVVVDECHMIKTQGAARTKAVRRLARNAKAFVALSGTPITHHPANLWPTLDSFAPGAWPSRERWVARYCATGFADYGENILGLSPHTEPEFRKTILGQYRRVARADLGWAPKSYEVRQVDMPAEYRDAYDEFEAQMLTDLPDDGGELSVMDVLTKMTFLSRLACAAADVETTVGPDVNEQTGELKIHTSVHPRFPSWTIDELARLIDESPKTPRVVFADARPLAMMAGQAAESMGLRVGYIVGKQSRKTRTGYRRAFQAGELDLICATVSAGGVGITLNRAEQLVFLQRPWSLVDSIQAEDRGVGDINAPGCHVIDIVTKNTIHTRVRAVLRERAGQLADLVQDPRIVAELLGGASIHELRKAS